MLDFMSFYKCVAMIERKMLFRMKIVPSTQFTFENGPNYGVTCLTSGSIAKFHYPIIICMVLSYHVR